jgi:hypothetical protein
VGAYLKEVPLEDVGYGNSQFDESGSFTRDLDDAKYTFNLGYTLPDLFKVTATYRPKSHLGTAYVRARVTLPYPCWRSPA